MRIRNLIAALWAGILAMFGLLENGEDAEANVAARREE